MKRMLIYLALTLLLVNCGGETHSDYYEGQTHEIQGKVEGALENTKVTLYLDDKSEPIARADVQSDGSYVLKFTPEVNDNIVDNKYLLLSAENNETSLKSIVTFYDSNSSQVYKYKDTVISGYTDAIYKVKSALLFDKNATTLLVKKFMPLYNKGRYDSTKADAYAFAYNGIMDELAEHHEYDKSQTFEALEKISTLNKEDVEVAKEHNATKYAFAIVKKIDESTIVQEVTLKVKNNLPLMEASTTYSLSKKKIGATNYFDGATNYIILADNESVLETPKVTVWDSNETVTKSRRNISLYEFKTGSKTSIIKNLKLDLDNSISSKVDVNGLAKMKEKVLQKKSFGDCSADIYVYYNGKWRLEGRANNVAFRSALNLRAILPSKFEKARAIRINWDVGAVVIYKTFFFYDPDGIYSRGIVASATAQNTNYISSMTYDNNFPNEYEYKDGTKWTEPWTPTHTIIELDKVLTSGIGGSKTLAWKNSAYAGAGTWWAENPSQDTRNPLLLIHGWQAPKAEEGRNPAIIRDYEHNEFDYWHNFISYYLSTPDLYNKFKLYTYHYPSYKHITFNGRILANLLSELEGQNSVIGRGLNEYNGLAIIGHSMGGLIARSMIEEHYALGYNAEVLAKLIALDTPHHGSHGASITHWSANVVDKLKFKDLRSPGALDLMWDNYDHYYNCPEEGYEDCDNYKQILNRRDNKSRYKLLSDGNVFDDYYINKLASSSSYNLHDRTNPYLAYLNKNFVDNRVNTVNSIGENKYIFYIAHISGDKVGPSKISNPIETNKSFSISNYTFKQFGYASGGAEPVCSAFLTKQNQVDSKTRFRGNFEDPSDFIVINNSGVRDNNYIAYRYFWDYEHEGMLSGRAKERGSWDRFIDNKNPISSNENACAYSTYNDLVHGSGCGTQHYNYYLYAFNFLYGTNHAINKQQIYGELKNPLLTEPIFMTLQKDLKDIN